MIKVMDVFEGCTCMSTFWQVRNQPGFTWGMGGLWGDPCTDVHQINYNNNLLIWMQIDHAMNLIFSPKKKVFLYLLPIFDKFHNLFLATNSIDTHHYEITILPQEKKWISLLRYFCFLRGKTGFYPWVAWPTFTYFSHIFLIFRNSSIIMTINYW